MSWKFSDVPNGALTSQYFAECMVELGDMFGIDISEKRMESMFGLFEKQLWSCKDFYWARQHLTETCRFFPSYSEFYQWREGSRRDIPKTEW